MSTTDSLDVRIKNYEKSFEHKIPFDEFVIVRIDGHKFSKFTKTFKKPFDSVLSNAMENTTLDLVQRFGAATGYTQSDEITLVFPPVFKEKNGDVTNNQVFAGRTQKISSLTASYASIRFNYWLGEGIKDVLSYDTVYRQMVAGHVGIASFDSRVFGVPSKEEAFNVVMWRMLDTVKNSKSMFAQAYCSHKSLLNKNGNNQIKYCFDTTGNDWHKSEERFKYGIFVKKEKYMKTVENIDEIVERTRVTSFVKSDAINFNSENVDLIMRKLL